MQEARKFQIITFYEFRTFTLERLASLKRSLREAMKANAIKGTFILAEEGFNAAVCGELADTESFIQAVEEILSTKLRLKTSFHAESPFRKIDVKIKPEIVTLKKKVNIAKGVGTHVGPAEWNEIISDASVVVLDARNDYEFKNGTFRRAVNPGTEKFSDLPAFVAENLDPKVHQKVAMFCTGGIRCEKFAPYMKELGFKEVFQLDGGILRYLEETDGDESLWQGECFVFDERRTVDRKLAKGVEPDHSQKKKSDRPNIDSVDAP